MSHFQNLAIFRHTDYTIYALLLIFFTKFVTISSTVMHIVCPKTYAIGCFLRHPKAYIHHAIIFLKALAKVKFEKTPGSKEFRELTASNWVNTTCRDIQTAVIKTCAYTNRFALKCAFGEAYNELYPGTIYSPPSYNAHFSSTEG